jgi:hypothetical protein
LPFWRKQVWPAARLAAYGHRVGCRRGIPRQQPPNAPMILAAVVGSPPSGPSTDSNHHIRSRSILDQGWIMFATFLEYKEHERGGRVEFTPTPYTSLHCPNPNCGHTHTNSRPTRDRFCCEVCGCEEHADVVGANVSQAGYCRKSLASGSARGSRWRSSIPLSSGDGVGFALTAVNLCARGWGRIGVGSIDWFRCPLPPNRTCGSPDIRLSGWWSYLRED